MKEKWDKNNSWILKRNLNFLKNEIENNKMQQNGLGFKDWE
jgi:hypothetical protein